MMNNKQKCRELNNPNRPRIMLMDEIKIGKLTFKPVRGSHIELEDGVYYYYPKITDHHAKQKHLRYTMSKKCVENLDWSIFKTIPNRIQISRRGVKTWWF